MPPTPDAINASAIYVAAIVLMGLALTYLVIFQRRSKQVGIGDGGDRVMARAIRVHGNFCENAPFALALLVMLPLAGSGAAVIHAVGLPFVIGRAAHAQGLWTSGGPSLGRIAGMILTHTSLTIGAVALVWTAFAR